MIDEAKIEAMLQRVADRAADRVAAAIASAMKPPPDLLTRAELAKRLGISVATVCRWENPPSVCVGDEKTRRYDLDEVRAWLAEREPKATTPSKREPDVDVSGALAAAGLRSAR